MPRLIEPPRIEVEHSPALSLTARPGDGSIRGRKIAILLAPGVEADSVSKTRDALAKAGAVVRLVAHAWARSRQRAARRSRPTARWRRCPRSSSTPSSSRTARRRPNALASLGQALEFIKDQYRHCKAILMLGTGRKVVEGAGVIAAKEDWAMASDVKAFIQAVGRHRNWDRAIDPPKV